MTCTVTTLARKGSTLTGRLWARASSNHCSLVRPKLKTYNYEIKSRDLAKSHLLMRAHFKFSKISISIIFVQISVHLQIRPEPKSNLFEIGNRNTALSGVPNHCSRDHKCFPSIPQVLPKKSSSWLNIELLFKI